MIEPTKGDTHASHPWADLMAPRFDYRRMTGEQFNLALETLKIEGHEFARISGATHRKVGQWQRDEEDIPPWVTFYLTLLTIPGALRLARKVAAETIRLDRENMHRGEWPYKRKEERDDAR